MEENKRWEEVLRLTEHPEDFSEDQKKALLDDGECLDLYRTIADMRQAMTMSKTSAEMNMPETDAEWKRFRRDHIKPGKSLRHWSAAACIGAVLVSGIAVAAFRTDWFRASGSKDGMEMAENTAAGSVAGGKTARMPAGGDTIAVPKSFTYDNAPLERIMNDIAGTYGVKVRYGREAAKDIRLYMQWDSSRTLEEVITLLNHFEQVHISYNQGMITVE